MEKKNILVTGGCGFVGSNLVKRLLFLGHNLTILDKVCYKKEYEYSGIDFVVGDVEDGSILTRLLGNCDIVFHLAAILSNESYEQDWNKTNRINFLATEMLFKIASSLKKPPSIIYASSSSVYGNNNLPFCEKDIVRPNNAYGIDKLSCETSATFFGKHYGLKTIGLRFFNIYGPKQNIKSCFGVIPKFIDDVINLRTVFIYGDGNQTRDFIYIDDAVDSMIKAMNMINYCNTEVINICSGAPTSINSLVQQIQNIINPAKVVYIKKSYGIQDNFGSTVKAKKLLNWEFKTELPSGIIKTINSLSLDNYL